MDNNIANEWKNIAHAANTYAIDGNATSNPSCNNVDTINAVLVKKYANWDRQHSNGFNRSITSHGIKFGDVNNIIIDLKINSAKTTLPSIDSIKTIYSSYLANSSQVDEVDTGKINIGLTLEGDKSGEQWQGGTVWNGSIIIELDQTTLADQWLRISIPISKLPLYEQKGYDPRQTRDLTTFGDMVIRTLMVVGETRSGDVLRGKMSNWNDAQQPPEHFKEMDISFKKIAFELK